MRPGLRLPILEALPEEIRAQLGLDHGDGELVGPCEALVRGAAGVPGRGEGGAGAALCVPLREGSLREVRGCVRAVGVRGDDAEIRGRTRVDQVGDVGCCRAPADGVAARKADVREARCFHRV